MGIPELGLQLAKPTVRVVADGASARSMTAGPAHQTTKSGFFAVVMLPSLRALNTSNACIPVSARYVQDLIMLLGYTPLLCTTTL